MGRLTRLRRSVDDVGREQADRLLFRFGFLCHAASDRAAGDETWTALRPAWPALAVGEIEVYHHPETQVAYRRDGDRHTVLLGVAFDSTSTAAGDPLAALAAADEDALLDLLDVLSGRFALLILDAGNSKVFHDPVGSRTLFYAAGSNFAIGSHAELVAAAVGARRRDDVADFVRSPGFRRMRAPHLPGDATLFDGVYSLAPNNYYDVGRRRPVRFWPRRSHRPTRVDDFFSGFDRYLEAFAAFLRAPRRPIVSVTGGIDSRTLLAALVHHGADLRAVTWSSFNFARWEASPVKALVSYLGVPHAYVDRSNDRLNAVARVGARNSGGYRGPSGVVAGMHRLYGGDADSVFVRGLGAETIRDPFHTSRARTGAEATLVTSAGDMARVYADETIGRRDSAFDRVSLAAFDGFWDRAGYDGLSRSGYDLTDIFHWEHRVGMWGAASVNAMDPAVDSMIGFNSRAVLETAFGLPPALRRGKQLFIDVILRYDERLAAIPYR